MTAKKKVSSKPKAKSPKAKTAASKAAVIKKPATQASSSKKKPEVSSSKNKANKGKSVISKVTSTASPKKTPAKKAVTAKKGAKPKVSSTSKSTKSKTTSGKEKSKPSSAKSEPKSSAVAKLRELASKSISQVNKEEKTENTGFSISDIRSILSSRKKATPKKVEKKVTPKVETKKKTKSVRVSKVKKITSASIDDILGFGVPLSNTKQVIRDEKKVPKQWKTYYDSLVSMRNALKGALGERSSDTIGASARESGELSLNSSDAGTETFDRDLALSMVANDHEALEEIEDAIDRIFDGSYGVCQETNKPINKNRLRAVPFTRFSLEGQNLFESSNRKDRDLGAGTFATIADSTMGEDD